MKENDSDLNEHAAAGSSTVYPTRDDACRAKTQRQWERKDLAAIISLSGLALIALSLLWAFLEVIRDSGFQHLARLIWDSAKTVPLYVWLFAFGMALTLIGFRLDRES